VPFNISKINIEEKNLKLKKSYENANERSLFIVTSKIDECLTLQNSLVYFVKTMASMIGKARQWEKFYSFDIRFWKVVFTKLLLCFLR
jgi:hypothetical protein